MHHRERVAAQIHRIVQSALARGFQDPRIRGLVSVTKVELEPDLSEAVISVSVLPAERGQLAVEGLRHAAGRIRREIGRSAKLRRVPRLSFRLDHSIKKQAEVEAALAEGREPTEEGQ